MDKEVNEDVELRSWSLLKRALHPVMPWLSEDLQDCLRKLAVHAGIILLVIAGCGMAAGLVLHGGPEAAQSRNVLYFIDQAREAVQQSNWPRALGAIKNVPESKRQSSEFLHVLAEYLEGTGTEPQLLARTLERLSSTEPLDAEQQLWLCRARLYAGEIGGARATWDKLPDATRQGLEGARLNVDILRKEGRVHEAAEALAVLTRTFAAEPDIAVRQAAADINDPFPEMQHHAEVRLWELAQRQNLPGLEALRMLSRQSGRTETEAVELLRLIDRHPDAEPADRLAVVSLLMRFDASRREEMLLAEVNRYKNAGPDTQIALVTWLAREGEAEKLWELPEGIQRLQPADWFPILARALSEQKRWKELLDLVQQQQGKTENESRSVSQAALFYWQAVALMQLHPEAPAEPHRCLQMAIRHGDVGNNLNALTLVAQTAEDWQMPDLALEAGLALARPGRPHEAHILGNCLRIALLLKDSARMIGIAERGVCLEPENRQAAHRANYLHLLFGMKLETTAIQTDADAVNGSAEWLLEALKSWRLGDVPGAVKAVRNIRDLSALQAGERAVYAGLLAKAGGDIARAYQIAEKIRPELLLTEERRFLDMAL